jgi:gliding motility-associated-like protein
MNKCIFLLLLFSTAQTFGQLGFCEGSKGDAIFHEDFGNGTGTGSPLPAGITDYTFVTGDPNDGEYTISGRIGMNNGTWHSYLPVSNISGGRALIVNADYNAGRFYRTPISGLCENTTYEFSAYLLNVYDRTSGACENGGIPVNVRFEIWDETDSYLIKGGSTGNIHSTNSPQWEQYGLTFQTVPGQKAVILKMFNEGEGGCGNDLAIDDIIFRSCGDLTLITTPDSNNSNFSICAEDLPASLILYADPDFSVYNQHYFQWQESTDNQNWSDILGETGDSYTTPPLNSSTFYRVKVAEDAVNLNNNLCSSASEAFFVEIIETPMAPVSRGAVASCENDPLPLEVEVQPGETVNWYDAPSNGNLLAEDTFTFFPPVAGTYFAEAIKDNSCDPGPRTGVEYSIYSIPILEDETLSYCGDGPLMLEAGIENLEYLWNTGETSSTIEVSTSGVYSVIITTNNGCVIEKQIEVNEVPIAGIEDVSSNGSTVIIYPSNSGLFEYSLDGINFQLSNKFINVTGGVYTAFVRDLQQCNMVSLEFPHIVVPQFITPNGDGYNDYFQLNGIEYFNFSEVRIFDRYGKLLKSGRGEGFRWDGTFKNRNLPADDYWYEISIENHPSLKGHFSLMR